MTTPQMEEPTVPTDAPTTALLMLAAGFTQTADDLELRGLKFDAEIWRECRQRVEAMMEMMSDESRLGQLRRCQRGVFTCVHGMHADLLQYWQGDTDVAAAKLLLASMVAQVKDLKDWVGKWEELKG